MAKTPRHASRLRALPDLVARYAQVALDDLAEQLDADVDLTPAVRDAMLALAAPTIHRHTRQTVRDDVAPLAILGSHALTLMLTIDLTRREREDA